MFGKIKSISADNGTQLSKIANELNIKHENIINIVWTGNEVTLFYYD